MTAKYNSAQRLINILEAAIRQPEKNQVLDVWTAVFNIDATLTPQQRSAEIGQHISIVHEEIKSIRKFMDASEFSEHLYEPYIKRAENSLSTLALTNPWESSKRNISTQPTVIYALKWCSEIMPNEPILDDEDINEIMSGIDSLISQLDSQQLPEPLKSYLEKHIQIIRKSISMYKISGIEAMTNAVKEITPELMLHQEENSKIPTEIKELLGTVWRKVYEFSARSADNLARLETLNSWLGKLLDYIP